MIAGIAAALPRRPLVLKPYTGAWRGWVAVLFGLVLSGGILFWASTLAPGVMDDFAMRNRAQPVSSARLVDGRCRSKAGILHDCSATIVARGKDGEVRRHIEQLFIDFHVGDWTVQVMGDPDRPQVLTTDIGLDRIWHRIVTLLLFVAFALAIPFGFWRILRTQNAERRRVAALSGQALQPVPVQVLSRNGNALVVGDEAGQAYHWTFPPRRKLFEVDPAQGLVLALRPAAGGGEAYPMDEKLTVVDLNDHERAAVRNARPA
jgi:hypothetical protein